MPFKFDIQKSINIVLFTIQSLGGKTDLYRILLILYFADLYHLGKYGTLITGDTYIAMKYGPVPFNILGFYKQIKGQGIVKGNPFNSKEHFAVNEDGQITAISKYNEDYLSESEVEGLFNAIQAHKKDKYEDLCSFAQDKAWMNANDSGEITLLQLIKASNATNEMTEYILASFENEIHSFNEDSEA